MTRKSSTSPITPTEYMTLLTANSFITAKSWKRVRPQRPEIISKNTLKVLALLIGQVKAKKDKTFESFSMTATELYRKIGVLRPPPHNTVLGVLEELGNMSRWLFDAHGSKSGNNEWHQVRILNEARYNEESGMITLELSHHLKPYLLNLKNNYTTQYVKSVLSLDSVTDIRLYSFLRQFVLLDRVAHPVPLHQVFSTVGIWNKEWAIFNRDVLRPSIKRVTSITELNIEYELVRGGRTDRERGPVDEIVFYVDEGEQKQTAPPVTPPIIDDVVDQEETIHTTGIINGESFSLTESEFDEEKTPETGTFYDENADY